MHTTIRRALHTGALCLAAFAPAEAGIVVTKKGTTFVGKLDPATTPGCPNDLKDMPEQVVMTWPHEGAQVGPAGRGELTFRGDEVRWYSLTADAPSDAYWAKHHADPIDVRWHAARDAYLERQREGDVIVCPPITPDFGAGDWSARKLAPQPQRLGKAEFKVPAGWTVRTVDGVCIVERPEVGAGGFRPKIHLFQCASVPALVPETVDLVQAALAEQLATHDANLADVQRSTPKAIAGAGFDVNLSSASQLGARKVRSLRKIAIRTEQTYFFAAYAHADDWSELESLFESCRRTLKVGD